MELDPRSRIDDEENPHYADDEEEEEDELEDDDEIAEALERHLSIRLSSPKHLEEARERQG